jgi:superfamily I DNA/RNA helicase
VHGTFSKLLTKHGLGKRFSAINFFLLQADGLDHQTHEPIRIVPHARTLRKARENVKWMVNDGISLQKTRNYLHRWWQKASHVWQNEDILRWFIASCWEHPPAAIAAAPLHNYLNYIRQNIGLLPTGEGLLYCHSQRFSYDA